MDPLHWQLAYSLKRWKKGEIIQDKRNVQIFTETRRSWLGPGTPFWMSDTDSDRTDVVVSGWMGSGASPHSDIETSWSGSPEDDTPCPCLDTQRKVGQKTWRGLTPDTTATNLRSGLWGMDRVLHIQKGWDNDLLQHQPSLSSMINYSCSRQFLSPPPRVFRDFMPHTPLLLLLWLQ